MWIHAIRMLLNGAHGANINVMYNRCCTARHIGEKVFVLAAHGLRHSTRNPPRHLVEQLETCSTWAAATSGDTTSAPQAADNATVIPRASLSVDELHGLST